jgi:cytochrome P450
MRNFGDKRKKMKTKSNSPFAGADYKVNPYAIYAQMRSETPVLKTVLPDGVDVFLVTRYQDVQAGLKDPRLVKNIHNARPQGLLDKLGFGMNNSNMLKADPPEHTRLRGLANEAFKPKYINQLRGHIEEIANQLLDKVQAVGKMDLIADFAFPLPITVICEMLGVPTKDDDKFRAWSTALIASGALSSESPHLGKELLQLGNYVRKLIADHRKHPREDVISQLIHAENDGDKLTDMELLGTTVLLLIAGHETTVNLIGNGMLALLQHPDQLEKLKADPALIKPAVEEILRYVNPVQIVNRYAAEDLEIAGQQIPRGSHLQLVLAAANHDPAYVSDPEQLNITREEARHVAFSQGIHYCLGAPLARLEGEIAFITLLKRLPDIHLAIAPEALEWRPAYELRGLKSLPVVFSKEA